MTARRRRILFAGFVARMGEEHRRKRAILGELVGSKGYTGGLEKEESMGGLKSDLEESGIKSDGCGTEKRRKPANGPDWPRTEGRPSCRGNGGGRSTTSVRHVKVVTATRATYTLSLIHI